LACNENTPPSSLGLQRNSGQKCKPKKHLLQVEPSSDANSWARREERYERKFQTGRKYSEIIVG